MEDGAVGVATLLTEDCEEWPSLDCERRLLLTIGPPVSDTGSSREVVRSWPPSGRGRREPLFVEVVAAGLLVKVSETAVFGRAGLVWRVVFILIFRFSVSLLESNTSPSPISRPDKKSSLTSARLAACFSLDW